MFVFGTTDPTSAFTKRLLRRGAELDEADERARLFVLTDGLQLVHGNTVHGRRLRSDEAAPVPLTYFHPHGPAGQLFRVFKFDPSTIGAAS